MEARDYAEAHGLVFDESLSFQDLGVSAYRGANKEAGKLADFLLAVRHGEVERGSYLLVESLDRLSRDTARKALRTLEDICDEGITVITLIDNQKYTSETLDHDPASLFFSLVIFLRANEESETKSKRVKAAWQRRIERARNGEKIKISGSIPSWLRIEGDKFVINKEKTKSIKLIFHLAELGIGSGTIGKTLNLNNLPTLGTSKFWERTKVQVLLKNQAVIGTLVPSTWEMIDGKRVRITQEPLRGYYPRIIPEKTWKKAQFYIERRRKRYLEKGRGYPDRTLRGIFAYLAKCPECGNAMTRRRYRPSHERIGPMVHTLVCSLALNSDKCKFAPVVYEPLEEEFLNKGIEMMQNHLDNLLDESMGSAGVTDSHELNLLGARVEAIAKTIDAQPLERKFLNRQIKNLFERVVINYSEERLGFEWKYGGRTELSYKARLCQYLETSYGR